VGDDVPMHIALLVPERERERDQASKLARQPIQAPHGNKPIPLQIQTLGRRGGGGSHGCGGEGVEEGFLELERALLPLLRRCGARADRLVVVVLLLLLPLANGGGGSRAIEALALEVSAAAFYCRGRYGGVGRRLGRRRHGEVEVR
jgi:hypothetical protein